MTPQEFFYWLQGYFELTPAGPLTHHQVTIALRHIALVEATQPAGPGVRAIKALLPMAA